MGVQHVYKWTTRMSEQHVNTYEWTTCVGDILTKNLSGKAETEDDDTRS